MDSTAAMILGVTAVLLVTVVVFAWLFARWLSAGVPKVDVPIPVALREQDALVILLRKPLGERQPEPYEVFLGSAGYSAGDPIVTVPAELGEAHAYLLPRHALPFGEGMVAISETIMLLHRGESPIEELQALGPLVVGFENAP